MRIILIRHSRTLFNLNDLIMGWGDSPQADGWENDAFFIEQKLKKHGLTPDAIYSSTLGRSRLTADFFAARFNNIDRVSSEELNEVNYGSLTAKKKQWVKENYPLHKKDPDFIYPDGESFRQMQRRSVAYIDKLALNQPESTILLVSHAGVIRGLVSHYLQLDYCHQLKHGISHRYIGLLQIQDQIASVYDELGALSGFIMNGIVNLPYSPN